MRKLFLIFISIILVAGFVYFFQTEITKAGPEHNVSGWTWSENIGWISFNCTNQGTCARSNYGVNIDPLTGILSGYAWSEHIGWISFNEADLIGCPISPCQAKLDFTTNRFSGWARVLARDGGWNGWIRLKGTNYGVWLDTRVSPYEFRGWAWSDMVIGWISFNCKDRNVCGTSNYRVMISLSSATNLRAQVFPNPVECAVPYPGARLSWTFTDPDPGDTQSAYRVQVDNNSDFSSPEIDSGKVLSSSNSYATPSGKLSWNTTYYWRLMVWDSKNVSSRWVVGPSFTTPLHAYPFIDFSWLPERPTVNELVQFTDKSKVFGGTTKVSWFWTFQDAIPSSSDQQNPSVKFTSTGPKIVTLKVTDSNGFTCTGQKTINARLPLPEWREIPPIIWLKNSLAGLGEILGKIF